MMHKFLIANRAELIARCRAKVAKRAPLGMREEELQHGVTIFLDQLIKTLAVERAADSIRSRKVSGRAGGGKPALSEISESAALHGKELQQHGFTVEEVVHDYGDLCQANTELASERGAAIGIDEFRTLNRCRGCAEFCVNGVLVYS